MSFIPDISIAPLQVHYYSEALQAENYRRKKSERWAERDTERHTWMDREKHRPIDWRTYR